LKLFPKDEITSHTDLTKVASVTQTIEIILKIDFIDPYLRFLED